VGYNSFVDNTGLPSFV